MSRMDSGYELLDVGDGRRLERFGALVVDRPARGADAPRRDPGAWAGAITYRDGRGWAAADGNVAPTDAAVVEIGGVRLLTALAAGGQVGAFPEHAGHVAWVRAAVRGRGGSRSEQPPSVLNLFAYTGLLTLVAAAAGGAVTHVDASRPAVAWARRNAAANDLEDRPVRWIVDDALAFVRRETRRERRYDGLVLDPPSYGHGGEGHARAFRLEQDVERLLDACRAVAAPDAFWLVSTHTIGWDAPRLGATVAGSLGIKPDVLTAAPMDISARSGARLQLGAAVLFDPLEPQPR